MTARVTSIHALEGPLDDERRGEAVFAGDILIFKDVPPLRAFSKATIGVIGETLGDAPTKAHLALSRPEFDSRAAELTRALRRDARVAGMFHDALRHVGVALRDTFWDWLYLRIQPPSEFMESRTLPHHRDTWASNVYAQTNWWTPIFPVTSERTIAFYPAYWSRRLSNTSAEWDLRRVAEMPLVPEATEQPTDDSEVRIVIEPGDLLCFSGAHLHASVPNTTSETRFSVEARTVYAGDIRSDRGAPNVDGQAPETASRWFRGLTSGASLTDLARP